MATVYKIEIKLVSPFVNHDESYIEKLFKDFLTNHVDENTAQRFESIEVDVEKIA